MKTFSAKSSSIIKCWYYVDATGKILGRLATELSKYLRGKHKVEYTQNIDIGDYIVVLNASKIIVTGKKRTNKMYYRHTGYVGGIKKINFEQMLLKNPKQVIEIAVKGMLPKGPLGRSMFRKLKVYSGNIHNHIAQKPQLLKI
ncbi:50S ribosomal protein L13 [Buchnera aphidicola (Hormaphis cornu)]|nr:50S ribosomal protein L13 [Buchnera aphidicola (Hormaphis cornu)]